MIEELVEILGARRVLCGADTARYAKDWTGKFSSVPLAVVRPADTKEVAACVRLCARRGVPVVPVGGNTGLVGGTLAEGQVMISLERLNRVREIKSQAQIAIVEAGAVLQDIHAAADAENLVFPLTFGARGSAQIGGALATNAGGSNVLRYGATRGLCLGVEVVLASGEILNLMSELHKDNTGYALKDLFIGAEGTLGIITAAVLKLSPKPEAYATAQIALRDLDAALVTLRRLQAVSSGAVEAFEYMPQDYMARLAKFRPDLRAPFATGYDTNVMVELGGGVGIQPLLEEALTTMMEEGLVLDAVIAQNETQRAEIWERREAAAEITFTQVPVITADICLPLDQVPAFFETVRPELAKQESDLEELTVAHLGDGNLHFTVYPRSDDPDHLAAIQATIDAVTVSLGGSVSAEHGVGVSKLSTMRSHKDPVALKTMAALKATLDPQNILNPGKVVPQ